MLFGVASFLSVAILTKCQLIHVQKDGLTLNIEITDALQLTLTRDGSEKLSATIGRDINYRNYSRCTDRQNCVQFEDSRLEVHSSIENGFTIVWSATRSENIFRDCYDLNTNATDWFGGPERYHQLWPIQKLELSNFANVAQEDGASAVVEPYWLSSRGAYIFVDEKVPLFIDQNTYENGAVCFVGKNEAPYPRRSRVLLNYTVVALDTPRNAHLHAVRYFLGKPTGHPNKKMIERPIWSTWARYKRNVSDDILMEFAREIVDHGFSDGQFEIDDFWETCYGSLVFRSPEFVNITRTVQAIKDLGFRVTLWAHPFVNVDCDDSEIGIQHNFFVKNEDGSALTQWWNSNNRSALLIDFTKADVRQWFTSRLERLQETHGIDSFKFDAGESSWSPQVPVFQGDVETSPNRMTSDYVRACAQFGDLVEVRSAWKTQDLPIFVRMIDKDSRWGSDNGLYTLLTTLLQMNLNGYSLVLPDMVGGNGYDNSPSAELFVRWLQANTFMPSIQFSYVPWDYDDEEFNVVEISRTFVNLHILYAGEIIKAIEKSINDGSPTNSPIWWIDNGSVEALKEDTEYVLGEDILVAPILQEGAVSRNIYLPTGKWVDGNTGTVYEGNQSLVNYSAPIDILPYFVREGSNAWEIHNNRTKLDIIAIKC